MSQYFDRDFFRFLMGFISIVIVSLVIIAVLRQYQSRTIPEEPDVHTASAIQN